jgi:hypothetical protein
MNLRKRLKRKRARWEKMARANCKLFGIPFKTFLTWDELPDVYKDLPYCQDLLWKVTHYGRGMMLIDTCVKESDFTLVEET